MVELDSDGAVRLAAAVARLWLAEEPHEIPVVSQWLGCDPGYLLRGLGLSEVPPPPPPKPAPTCEQCGGPVPITKPQRRFCDRCRAERRDASSLRSKQKYGSRTRRRA